MSDPSSDVTAQAAQDAAALLDRPAIRDLNTLAAKQSPPQPAEPSAPQSPPEA